MDCYRVPKLVDNAKNDLADCMNRREFSRNFRKIRVKFPPKTESGTRTEFNLGAEKPDGYRNRKAGENRMLKPRSATEKREPERKTDG